MMRLIKDTNINFLGVRKWAYGFSITLLVIALASVIWHKGFNTSIEFTGGTMIQLKFQRSVDQDMGKVRSIISALDFGSPEIKSIGAAGDNEIQIVVKKQAEGTTVADAIKQALKTQYADNPFELRNEQKVGPKIGKELIRNAFWAILLSMIAIIIYIWVRFNLPYGFGGVVGIFHDCFITLGFFSITNREISLGTIAAILTIMGYSINDTIVIFDRVRENLGGKLVGKDLEIVINKSINQCLSRTIITTSTVLFVLIAFAFFGGTVIRDFALALLVGCMSGVYSTVYIASPIVVEWHKKWPMK
jgi:preprotein translocase subunit SecF